MTVRSIDAADEDFADLNPLIEAIGSGAMWLSSRNTLTSEQQTDLVEYLKSL